MTRKDNILVTLLIIGSIGVAILAAYLMRNTSFYYHPVTKAQHRELADWNLIIKLSPLSGLGLAYLIIKKYFKKPIL